MFGLYALAGGAISFIGWAADLPTLTSWDRSGISIQPNSAIAVMSAGTALVFRSAGRPRVAALLGLVVALIGGGVLFEYVSGVDLGIDRLFLFDRTWGRTGVPT